MSPLRKLPIAPAPCRLTQPLWKLGVLLAFVAGGVFAAHPVFHSGLAEARAADTRPTTVHHCALSPTQLHSADPAPPTLDFSLPISPKLPPLYDQTELRFDEPALRALSPRAPPVRARA